MRAADVHNLSLSLLRLQELKQSVDAIAYVGKVASLASVSENADWLAFQGGLNEVRQHHAVAAGLPWSNYVEEPGHDHRQAMRRGVGEGKELVQFLRSR